MKIRIIVLCFLMWACQSTPKRPLVIEEVDLGLETVELGPPTLSEWGFFQKPLNALSPVSGVVPYRINSSLFSDYAQKARFLKLPENKQAIYHPTEVFWFPEGTVLIKNFFYPSDSGRDEENIHLIETRLLIREPSEWKALTYVWNVEQTEAYLEIAGASVPVSWENEDGEKVAIDYSVPNLIQCKSCHEYSGKMELIGPTVRQLNRYTDDGIGAVNQLLRWKSLGILEGLPSSSSLPRMVSWEEVGSGDVASRARAWLEVNCAHCHRPEGPAKNTGLVLLVSENDPFKLGIYKPPVAAGRGSAGLRYSIVPGKPGESILYHRISSLDPGVMMPELGRKLNHEEGLALVYQWITELE